MRMRRVITLLTLTAALCHGQEADPPTSFAISYVAADAVYIKAGRDAGLAEGFRLTVKRVKPDEPVLDALVVGEIVVISVAGTSAASEIASKHSRTFKSAILPSGARWKRRW